MASSQDRPLPHNFEAERNILGAILLDNAALKTVLDKGLKPEHFFADQNRHLLERIMAMSEAGHVVDEVTLLDDLRNHNLLDAAGGSGYLATLTDGIPRVNNVGSYARIVYDKYQLRDFAKETNRLCQRALEGLADPADLRAQLEMLLHTSGNGHRPKLVAVAVDDFLKENLRPIEFLVEPVIPVQGLVMIYAKRGRGKTYFTLSLCYSLSIGVSIFGWTIAAPRRTVYVDGEMPANVVQERLRKIYKSVDGQVPDERHRMLLITPDKQENMMPNIASGEGQRMIEDHLQEGDHLVLDNLSALSHGGKENEGESWDPVQEWLLRLRQRMITVTVLHHAGKGGTQRGTSKREDLLDTVIALREPADYESSEGARFEVHFEKLRRSRGGDQTFPFELKLDEDPRGVLVWLQRPLKEIVLQQCAEMMKAGLTDRDLCETLHISRYQLYRMKRKLTTLDE